MATLLDTGLLEFLLPLFAFLFIFVVIYALLSKTELLGKNQVPLNFLAAICIAAVSIFAGNLVKLISSVTPWIVFMIIILALVFGMYRFIGNPGGDKEVWGTFGGPTVISVIIIFIVLIGLISVFESDITPFSQTQDTIGPDGKVIPGKTVKNEVIATLTHPRLLGALFILVVSAFTIKLLADRLE